MSGLSEVHRLKSRLDSTFKRAPTSAEDLEFQSDFAKYLCVLVSGFLENAIIEIILNFVSRKGSPQLAFHIENELKYWANPNTQKIIKLLGSFDDSWRVDLESYLIDARKETINSLVGLRNKVAHGESVSLSLSRVKDYYTETWQVIEHIEMLVGGA